MPRATIVFTAFFLAISLTACSSVWEDTSYIGQTAYNATKDLVNPDPAVDTELYQFDNPNQEKLARLFTPVDNPLGSMARFLSDQDLYPQMDWVEIFFLRYPWVHSLIIVDKNGWMLDRFPDDPIKRIGQPLVYEAKWRETFLQTVVDHPEMGPEFYIGTPWFQDADFSGLIIASFDPRVLFNFCPEPEQLVIIQPGGGAWTSDKSLDTQALLDLPWDEILEDDVHGQIEVGGRHWTWIVRYVAKDPYIYAVESVDPEYSGGWLF